MSSRYRRCGRGQAWGEGRPLRRVRALVAEPRRGRRCRCVLVTVSCSVVAVWSSWQLPPLRAAFGDAVSRESNSVASGALLAAHDEALIELAFDRAHPLV